MAIINCINCGKSYSDQRKSCPYCGLIRLKKRKRKRHLRLPLILFIFIVLSIIVTLIFGGRFYILNKNYNNAIKQFQSEDYIEAEKLFYSLNNFKDSQNMAIESKELYKNEELYLNANQFMQQLRYGDAEEIFKTIEDYKDSSQNIYNCQQLYANVFDEVVEQIQTDTEYAQVICAGISEVWNSSINARVDFNEIIGQFLKRVENSNKDSTDSKYYKLREKIDNSMKIINNPTSNYITAYDMLIELYGVYVQIYSQSKSPTGTLISFNQEIKSLNSEFEKIYNKIMITKPNNENYTITEDIKLPLV